MKVIVLYRDRSDHAREVTSFVRDFEHQTHKTVELLDVDTRAGDEKARLYDVVRYPAIVAVADDGRMLKLWDEPMLPRIQEISSYAE